MHQPFMHLTGKAMTARCRYPDAVARHVFGTVPEIGDTEPRSSVRLRDSDHNEGYSARGVENPRNGTRCGEIESTEEQVQA